MHSGASRDLGEFVALLALRLNFSASLRSHGHVGARRSRRLIFNFFS